MTGPEPRRGPGSVKGLVWVAAVSPEGGRAATATGTASPGGDGGIRGWFAGVPWQVPPGCRRPALEAPEHREHSMAGY